MNQYWPIENNSTGFKYIFFSIKRCSCYGIWTMLFTILFIFTTPLLAQKYNPVVVTLNPATGQVTNGDKIRFDEVFDIEGSFEDNKVTKAFLKYRIRGLKGVVQGNEKCRLFPKKYCPKKHYHILENNDNPPDENGYVTKPVSITGKKFNIIMDPLHPNYIYDLSFEFFKPVDVQEHQQTEFRNKVTDIINKEYGIDAKPREETERFKEINELIKNEIEEIAGKRDSVFDKNSKNIFKNAILSHDNNSKTGILIREHFDSTYSLLLKLNSAKRDLKATFKSPVRIPSNLTIIYNEYKKHRELLKTGMQEVFDDPNVAEKLKTTVLPDRLITRKTILEFLIKDISTDYVINTETIDSVQSDSFLFNILMGRAKIEDDGTLKSLTEDSSFDKDSFKLLLKTFEWLKDLKEENNQLVFKNKQLDILVEKLHDRNQHVISLVEDRKKLEKKRTEGADLLVDLYTNIYVRFKIPLLYKLESSDSPYIGIDVGGMYAPKISSFFVFQGFNFHLTPVNKRADFSRYRGSDWWKKRASIYLGLAQRVGTKNIDDRFERLTDLGSPFVGVGWRLFRGLRLNTGVLFYQEQNPNPLISDNTFRTACVISISLDQGFKQLIGGVSGTNISQIPKD